MSKKDDVEIIWRTVGGRRIPIRNGQSLSDAMKASGKFSSIKPLTNTDGSGIVNYREKIDELKSDKYPNDTTYDLDTLEPVAYDDGYQVSFYETNVTYTDADHDALISEFKNSSSDGVVCG